MPINILAGRERLLGTARCWGRPSKTRSATGRAKRCFCCDNKIDKKALTGAYSRSIAEWRGRRTKEMSMMDELAPQPTRRVRGRPFEKGRSGNPLGRWVSCRNKTTIAAAAFLAGEAEALSR